MPISFYQNRIKELTINAQANKKQLNFLAIIRIGFFIVSVFVFYLSINNNAISTIALFSVGFVVFYAVTGVLLKKKLNKENRLNRLIAFSENEIKAIDHEYAHYEAGEEFIDNEHPFLADLDVFEPGGFFQYINRTSTLLGKLQLASYFQNPLHSKDSINSRQEAIKELSQKVDFRHNYATLEIKNKITTEKKNQFEKWLHEEQFFSRNYFIIISSYLFPAISILAITLSAFSVIPGAIVGIVLTLNLGIIYRYIKTINKNHVLLSNQYTTCKQYSHLIKLIEETSFNSELLKHLKTTLQTDNKKASAVLQSFARLVSLFDNRLNFIVAILFNALFLRDFHIMLQLEKWKSTHSQALLHWFNTIAEFDALQSLANYYFNNPDYCFPLITDSKHRFQAKELGHPLIPKEKRVCNNYEQQSNTLTIITGANMAGKSTFLRTIGLSLLLAGVGLPVCAKSFSFSPRSLRPRINTKDSLQNNESYFATELRKLQAILLHIEENEHHFLLFDEILRGTNSKDKLVGSKALIEKLVTIGATGIIATHDVELGDLEKTFPTKITNLHFDAEIVGEDILFDYKIKQGICTKMNAAFLMKKMGIT